MPPPPPKSPDHHGHDGPEKPIDDSPQQKPGDFVERDLWELDDEWDADETLPATAASARPTGDGEAQAPTPSSESGDATSPPPPDEEIAQVLQPMPTGDSDFDDLPPMDPTPQPAGDPAADPREEPVESPDQGLDSPSSLPYEDPSPETDDEPKPAAKEPAPAPRRTTLSKLELISLTAVLALLLGVGGWFFRTFFEEIPTRRARIEMPDFPVTGERARIDRAATFWRHPLREGENRDAAGGDVKLIPVLELTLESGDKGALRVFFRDGDGELVGDSLTREFSAGSFKASSANTVQVAATAGFDDEGMHAAYQASQSDLWTVEVFEGPSKDASFDEFKLLFKLPISTDLR